MSQLAPKMNTSRFHRKAAVEKLEAIVQCQSPLLVTHFRVSSPVPMEALPTLKHLLYRAADFVFEVLIAQKFSNGCLHESPGPYQSCNF